MVLVLKKNSMSCFRYIRPASALSFPTVVNVGFNIEPRRSFVLAVPQADAVSWRRRYVDDRIAQINASCS